MSASDKSSDFEFSGVLNMYHGYYTTIMKSKWLFRHNPVSRAKNQTFRKSELVQCMKVE